MKIKITGPGIYGADGKEIAIGTTFEVKEEPAGWAGRFEVISGGTSGKTPVTNPDDPARAELDKHTVAELKKLAEDEKIDLGEATAKGDIVAKILAARVKA